jgi:hypothetical protein
VREIAAELLHLVLAEIAAGTQHAHGTAPIDGAKATAREVERALLRRAAGHVELAVALGLEERDGDALEGGDIHRREAAAHGAQGLTTLLVGGIDLRSPPGPNNELFAFELLKPKEGSDSGGIIEWTRIAPDDARAINGAVTEWLRDGAAYPHLVITTGGTGMGLRDGTPVCVKVQYPELKVTAAALRNMDRMGGLDNYILRSTPKELGSLRAESLRFQMKEALDRKAARAAAAPAEPKLQ